MNETDPSIDGFDKIQSNPSCEMHLDQSVSSIQHGPCCRIHIQTVEFDSLTARRSVPGSIYNYKRTFKLTFRQIHFT